ncbi:MAG: ABC transporter permease [Lachnospiraceae bacterium]|nr:ABC transporter permease [Lachnospiraceae bacterium]
MNNIITIIKKQLIDTLKNKTVLIQFIMFPLLGIIMTKAIKIEGMPENFFVNLFATMYIGMAPLTSVSAIISEEKEKNTLRVLLMADVSPIQYLLGIGSYVFSVCTLGGVIFCCLLNGVTNTQRVLFLAVMAVGIIASVMLGAAIGVGSKNQMSATSVSVPVMMVFSFLPMLSMFNDKIEKVAKITYSEQIRILMSSLKNCENHTENVVVIFINIVLFGIVFSVLYKKQGLT